MSAGQQEQEKDIDVALLRISDYLRQSLFFQNARPEDREPLKPCDLSGLALARIDLARCSLPNLIAVKTILSDAKLDCAKLNGAKLNGAELNGAELNCAKLNEATLNDAELNGAKLIGAELIGAELIGAKLNGAKLTRAELICANLNGAKLIGAKLNDAEMNGAKLDCATLNDAELIGAELIGADLSGANVSGAKFTLLPSILTANFSNTKNFGTAEFYTEEGVRVTRVAIGADGYLVPAADAPAAGVGAVQKFGAAARGAVAFKDIYPALLAEAREKGYVPPEHAPSSAAAGASRRSRFIVIDGGKTPKSP